MSTREPHLLNTPALITASELDCPKKLSSIYCSHAFASFVDSALGMDHPHIVRLFDVYEVGLLSSYL